MAIFNKNVIKIFLTTKTSIWSQSAFNFFNFFFRWAAIEEINRKATAKEEGKWYNGSHIEKYLLSGTKTRAPRRMYGG